MKQIVQILFILLILAIGSYADDCIRCHSTTELASLSKSSGIFQKAVGVMDKGQIQNNTGNFGVLSSFHVYFTNALHWPAQADYVRQYCFGLGFMVGIDENNVLETETQSQSKITDWLPPDDARLVEFSGDIVAESDDTPFMASSDLINTWPDIGWPGYFRVDVNTLTDEQLLTHPDALTLPYAPNQFSSDRDLFCTYNDASNEAGASGITVEQTAYSYGRPYAEDFIFWDLKVFNDGNQDLENIYVGLYAKFRPDFDNHDYVNFIDSDADGIKDLIYIYDLDNVASGAWMGTDDPLGMVGLRVFDTPGQIGITDFHHFSHEVAPTTDQQMWAIMASNRSSDSLIDPNYYFHGVDPRIDYTGTDSLAHYYPEYSFGGDDKRVGGAVDYIISCGPFDLPVDSMTTISFGLIMGDAGTVTNFPDTTDLMQNVRTAQDMYRLYFQGAGPPDPPTVHAVAGDQRVSLYWDAKAETSQDVWTGAVDFEGYRIFRSTDAGLTWGDPITDVYGNEVGYHPIAQFDYSAEEDIARYGVDVSGADPAFPQNLGDNTGLVHTFVDSNLVNGVEYWYSVSAYDKGDRSDPAELVPSYMNAPGQSWYEIHTVKATPGKIASDLYYGSNTELEAEGGVCGATVRLEFENTAELLDHDYELSFDFVPYVDEFGDDHLGMGAVLVDLTAADTLVNRLRIGNDTDTNTVIQAGFILYLEDATKGVLSMNWTKVAGDTCTFDWRTESKYPNLVPSGQAFGDIVESFDDWRITVDYNGGVDALWYDAFWGEYSDLTQFLPLKVEVVTDPDHPLDVTENIVLCDFNHSLTDDNEARPWFYSPHGWDLEPGGKGYLPGSPGWYEKHVDMLILEKIDTNPVTGDTIPNYLYLLTNNKPDISINVDMETDTVVAAGPTDGDEFTIITAKPFRPGITYRFNPLQQVEMAADRSINSLGDLIVVPDPYVVTNAWETNEFGKRLMFSNLPSVCTINIYTILGEHVDTVEHGGAGQTSAGYAFWDMRTRNEQFIAPGVYLYHAETPDGDETLGRFLVIK
ncbi:MAG: hypothetical protein U9Q77_10475 [Candidatus Marinimicrobia bacterium]|nr:hypothetical protein [Candidatus Neomarinimicrobiota bacterium]